MPRRRLKRRRKKRRRKHDASHKVLLHHPEALRELVIAKFGAEYAATLDFEKRVVLSPEHTDDDFKQRTGDLRVLIPRRDGGGYALLTVEHQSSIPGGMDTRLTRYVADAKDVLNASGVLKVLREDGTEIEMVVIVVYNGVPRWTINLEDALPTWRGGTRVGVLDLRRYAEEDEPESAMWHALARVELRPGTLWEVVAELRERYGGPEWADLRARLGRWLAERMRAADIEGFEDIDPETIMGDNGAIREAWRQYLAEVRAEGQAEGQARGLAEGRAEGQAEERTALLGRLTTRKFGAETAEMVAAAWGPGNWQRLDEVVDAIYECDTGADLLARVESMS